jgi:hypothetical protein
MSVSEDAVADILITVKEGGTTIGTLCESQRVSFPCNTVYILT